MTDTSEETKDRYLDEILRLKRYIRTQVQIMDDMVYVPGSRFKENYAEEVLCYIHNTLLWDYQEDGQTHIILTNKVTGGSGKKRE